MAVKMVIPSTLKIFQQAKSLVFASPIRRMPVICKFSPVPSLWRLRGIPFLLLSVLAAFSGCATYTPQPIKPHMILADLERVVLKEVSLPATMPDASNQSLINFQDGLNQDDAAVAAVLLNPGLREHLAAQGVAAGELIDAGLWSNPEFAMDLRQSMQTSGKSLEVSLAFELLRWEERRAGIARAEAGQIATRYALQAAGIEIAVEARRQWWEVVAARERLRLNADEFALADKLLQHLRAKLAVGAATALDLNLALLDKVQVQLDGLRLQKELAAADRALRAAIGLPPAAELTLQIPPQPFTLGARSADYAAALPRLLDAPALKGAEAEYQVAESELRAAVARQYPGLRFGPAATLEYDGAWTTLLGAVVSFDLPLFNRNQGEIAVKTAARDRLRGAYAAQLHRMRAELAEAGGALDSSRITLAFIDRDVLPPARESLRLAEAAYAAGNADVLEILKAQSAAIAINRQVLEAQIADRLLLESFQQALGQPFLPLPTPLPPASSTESSEMPDLLDGPPPAQP